MKIIIKFHNSEQSQDSGMAQPGTFSQLLLSKLFLNSRYLRPLKMRKAISVKI